MIVSEVTALVPEGCFLDEGCERGWVDAHSLFQPRWERKPDKQGAIARELAYNARKRRAERARRGSPAKDAYAVRAGGSASGRTEAVINSAVIKSRIRTLEFQLHVLKARIGRADDESFAPSRSFAELYGVLCGKADSTDEEINAVLYKGPSEQEDGG